MIKTIDTAEILKLMQRQALSVENWIRQFQENRDASSVRNASFSIGKYAGMFSILSAAIGPENIPEVVMLTLNRFTTAWDEMSELRFEPYDNWRWDHR